METKKDKKSTEEFSLLTYLVNRLTRKIDTIYLFEISEWTEEENELVHYKQKMQEIYSSTQLFYLELGEGLLITLNKLCGVFM